MSWKATYEFILSLENFRNIDLFDQGVYYMEFSIYYQDSQQNKQYATPYHFTQNNLGFKSQNHFSDQNIFEESTILDSEQKFKSKVFSIRYCEEEVRMNDLCCFRSEVNADNNYKLTEFYLECDLIAAFTTDPDKYKTEQLKFEKLSKFKSIIRYSSEGLHEFLPITFDKMHFCVLECSFHSLLLDFKFRNPEYLFSQNLIPSNQEKRERSKSFIEKIFKSKSSQNEDLEDTDEDDNQLTQDTLSSNSEKIKKKEKVIKGAKYKNINHFIQEVTFNFQKESVQSFYQFYVAHLKNQFSKLKRILDEVQDYSDPSNEDIIQMPHPSLIQIKDVDANSLEYYNQQIKDQQELDSLNKNNNFSSFSTKFESNSTFNYQRSVTQHGVTQKKKKEHLNENEQNIFISDVQREINQISGSLFQIWSQFIDLIVQKHSKLLQRYVVENNKQISERWGESIFRQKLTTSDLFTSLEDYTSTNSQIAKQFRKKFYFNNLEPLTIENLEMFPSAQEHPIFFQEIYQKRQSSLVFDEILVQDPNILQNQQKMGNHLIILCHGFQGNSFDLRSIKNNLIKQYPTAYCLSSKINEDHTDKDLDFLGKNLALEIRSYIGKRYIQCLTKMTFIGHSMGGVIARAALPYLKDYSSIMYSYISICSPHLGCYANSNKLIDAGLWIMQKIHKSQSLLQLSMRDSDNIEETYLYKLSSQPGLNWFQNVMFISSFDDQYVPIQSARVLTIPNGSKYHNQMVKNISQNFKCETIYRLDVNFKLDSSIDKMIGRAAHIHFLESEPFSQMLAYCYPEFFS
ncbi:hypothetical protein ABPG74_008977 [Tetrahymena malaccensis]